MFSPIASTIFTYRNFEKTENGEIGRAPVFIGQAAGVLSEVAKYDNAVAVGAKNVLSIFSDLAEGNKVLNYAGKFAKFASENVNPLIAVSGGVKVLMSDDKQDTAIKEAVALTAMFTGEGLVKKNYAKIVNTDCVKRVIKSISANKFVQPLTRLVAKNKWGAALGEIVKGCLFVAASMTSYNVGHKAGEKISKLVKEHQEKTLSQNEMPPEAPVAQDTGIADFVKINQVA